MLAQLRDRRLVTLRRIQPADKEMLAEPRFTSRELRYLAEVDFDSHYALVALAAEDRGRLLGVGRWVRDTADPGLARGRGDHR